IYAIRDIGLSIAFPLWNANSLLGIVWGAVFFNELRGSGWRRPLGVLGGAALMFAGATLLAVASAAGAPTGHAARGVAAALAAGALWGTMYIPYRKAYLTGMNPLAFVTFFSVGEVVMMLAVALAYRGGVAALAVALATTRGPKHRRRQEAAAREATRYAVDPAYVRAALAGESAGASPGRRSSLDWILVGGATATFVGFGIVARVPQLTLGWGWVVGLTAAMLALLSGTGWLLWRTTRFN